MYGKNESRLQWWINEAFNLIMRPETLSVLLRRRGEKKHIQSMTENPLWIELNSIETGFRPTLQCSITLQGWAKRRKSFQCISEIHRRPNSFDLQHSSFLYKPQSGWAGTDECIELYYTTHFMQYDFYVLKLKSGLNFSMFIVSNVCTVWHRLFRFGYPHWRRFCLFLF